MKRKNALKIQGKYVAAALCCFLSACRTGQTEYKYPEKVNGRYEMPSKKRRKKKTTPFLIKISDVYVRRKNGRPRFACGKAGKTTSGK